MSHRKFERECSLQPNMGCLNAIPEHFVGNFTYSGTFKPQYNLKTRPKTKEQFLHRNGYLESSLSGIRIELTGTVLLGCD